MKKQELLSALDDLERRKRQDMKDAETRFQNGRAAALQRFADENARFCVGDVISVGRSWKENRDYVRIERIEGHCDLEPEIWYIGQQLFPDFSENPTSSKGIITDRGTDEILRHDRPLYEGYVVTGGGEEKSSPDFRQVLDFCRYFCRVRKTGATVYGVDGAGRRTRLLYYPHIEIKGR